MPEVDKTELESEIAAIKAEDLSEDDFTETRWTTFQEALSAAEAVLADEDATQDEIDNALATLIIAYEGLEKVKELIPENSDEDEIIVDVGFDDDNILPDTATSTFNWLIGGFIAMLAMVAGLFTRRGKKDSKTL